MGFDQIMPQMMQMMQTCMYMQMMPMMMGTMMQCMQACTMPMQQQPCVPAQQVYQLPQSPAVQQPVAPQPATTNAVGFC